MTETTADEIARYRERAAHAERDAKQIRLREHKQMMLEIAAKWRAMAEDLERQGGG